MMKKADAGGTTGKSLNIEMVDSSPDGKVEDSKQLEPSDVQINSERRGAVHRSTDMELDLRPQMSSDGKPIE